jgi:hypothetical protein
MVKFQYLFHGTSTVYKTSIQECGLMPRNGALHLTTHPEVALFEARNTVHGEPNLRGGYKQAIGGMPLVVVIERTKVVRLCSDTEYYEHLDARSGLPVPEVRFAFKTDKGIAPSFISFIPENDCESECTKLRDQINEMARRVPLGFTVKRYSNGKMQRVWIF